MATEVPLHFRVHPFPVGYAADPNKFAEDFANRLRGFSSSPTALIASGTVLPTSDVGPFYKEDTREWYGWDAGSGTYVAQGIPDASLGYIAQISPGPDQAIYTFWIELDGTGKAKSIRYYSGGAWKDVYEDKFATYSTTAQMNAAISAAIGGSSTSVYPAYASASSKSVTADNTPVKIEFDTAIINPSGAWNTTNFEYTAPATGVYEVSARAQIDNDDATASGMEITMGIYVNNVSQPGGGGTSVASPPGARWYPVIPGQFVSLAENDVLDIRLAANDGVGTGDVTISVASVSIKKIA